MMSIRQLHPLPKRIVATLALSRILISTKEICPMTEDFRPWWKQQIIWKFYPRIHQKMLLMLLFFNKEDFTLTRTLQSLWVLSNPEVQAYLSAQYTHTEELQIKQPLFTQKYTTQRNFYPAWVLTTKYLVTREENI
jgi:hypothetical protein